MSKKHRFTKPHVYLKNIYVVRMPVIYDQLTEGHTLLLLLLLNSLHSIGEPHLYIGTVFNIWARSTDVNYSGGYRA